MCLRSLYLVKNLVPKYFLPSQQDLEDASPAEGSDPHSYKVCPAYDSYLDPLALECVEYLLHSLAKSARVVEWTICISAKEWSLPSSMSVLIMTLNHLMVLFTNPSARAGYDTRSIFKRS